MLKSTKALIVESDKMERPDGGESISNEQESRGGYTNSFAHQRMKNSFTRVNTHYGMRYGRELGHDCGSGAMAGSGQSPNTSTAYRDPVSPP